MSTTTTSETGDSFGVLSVLAVLLGACVLGYGLLLVPTSALGGAHVAAIGLSLVLSGVFATEWAGDRLGLTRTTRRRLSLVFAGLAVLLLAVFVALNFATFEGGEMEGSN